MAARHPAPSQQKHKRISAPKVRTGCITCKFRHLKCDEGKPACHRCLKDKMKCDGYAMSKPLKQRKTQRENIQNATRIGSMITVFQNVNGIPSLSKIERLYFQHFLQWTATQLSVSPNATNFWLHYALPMSYHSEPIRNCMVAVGVAHRLFIAHSVGHSHSSELKQLSIYQYNKAIASILPFMSSKSESDMHCIMMCCLLFVSFEGLVGRYDELLRHLSAGNTLLSLPLPMSTPEQRLVTRKLVDMFCIVGIDSSNFMEDDPFLLALSRCYSTNYTLKTSSDLPFQDLDEASYELRHLDLGHDIKPWHDDLGELGCWSEGEMGPNLLLSDSLCRWSVRLEESGLFDEQNRSAEIEPQLQSLVLRQQYWRMAIGAFSSEHAPSDPRIFAPFMAIAESVARPIISMKQPTFSLEGNILSGLAFVASTVQIDEIKSQALNLLRELNRREGILDSNDIVEMHELGMRLEECGSPEDEHELWMRPGEAPAGIPRIIERLRRSLGIQT